MYKQYPMHEGSFPTIFNSQMKSVQTTFHSLNVHCTTHGQDPPRKQAKLLMAMGIAKFNLRSRVACTWEWCKVVSGSVFFFQFCHVG
jgi:hypothetical protein